MSPLSKVRSSAEISGPFCSDSRPLFPRCSDGISGTKTLSLFSSTLSGTSSSVLPWLASFFLNFGKLVLFRNLLDTGGGVASE